MNSKRKIILTSLITLFFVLCCLCVVALGLKVYRHEKHQNMQISDLEGQIEYLETKLVQTTNYYDFEANYEDDSFNYFAIGNSLTLITSWGRGICSSEPDNDYFNLVVNQLKKTNKKVVAYPYNFSPWERLSNRDKAFDLIEPYLSSKLDLVTIQLGENAIDLNSYEQDLESLINHIKNKAPEATILIIGDWWSPEKNNLRKIAAQNTNSLFADLSPIVGLKEYQSETGLICNLSDGSKITVSEAASTHPGDKGMKYIADKVCEVLKLK